MRTPRYLINTSDAALHFWRAYHVRVSPAVIRQWAARKHITSYGFRRERYDLREIVAYAAQRGIIPEQTKRQQGGTTYVSGDERTSDQ